MTFYIGLFILGHIIGLFIAAGIIVWLTSGPSQKTINKANDAMMGILPKISWEEIDRRMDTKDYKQHIIIEVITGLSINRYRANIDNELFEVIK